jgi:hypothetical protein
MRTQEKDASGIRTISGTFTLAAIITAGTGFIVTKTGTGIYLIRFIPPFKSYISGQASPAQQANIAAIMFGGFADQVTIQTFVSSTLAQQDTHCSFIARGLA